MPLPNPIEQQPEDVIGPMREIAAISARLEQGASVTEVNAAYEAHEFPELERVESQMAMIKAVERVGKSAVVNQVSHFDKICHQDLRIHFASYLSVKQVLHVRYGLTHPVAKGITSTIFCAFQDMTAHQLPHV